MRKPIDSALLLAICTALLYSWGTAKHNGYLGTINLDSDMMERSFHQVIYSGFVVSFGPIWATLFITTIALLLWSYYILPIYIDYAQGSFKAKRRIIKLKHRFFGKRKRVITPIEKHEKNRFYHSLRYWSLFTLFLLSLVFSEREGKEQAIALIDNHLANKNDPNRMISVVIHKHEKSLRYLSCGAQNCAGIEEGSNKIFYFPQSNGYSSIYIPENTTGASNE